MPYLLSDWRDRIQDAVWEYRVAREGLDRLKSRGLGGANPIPSAISERLPETELNLEGTYVIRAFAVFDAALRSYDRYHFKDPARQTRVAVMIDQLGSLTGVPEQVRAGVHRARLVRHYWAHELEDDPGKMPIERVRGFLHAYLNWFPDNWT